MTIQASLELRFWKYVQRGGVECWLWHGPKMRNGYGELEQSTNGHRHVMLAHRIAYELHYGPIPAGLLVCHHCDVRACCNPAHLFVGTIRDNTYDAMRKGRVPQLTDANAKVRGDRHFLRLHPERILRGERNGFSKLTAEQVRTIRQRAACGETHVAIARDFGVSRHAVWRVVHRKNWSHI